MSLENLELLVSAVSSNQMSAYFEVASIAVLVYDYLLTLKLEIGLVWWTPWNLGKILFFLTRYMVFIDAGLLGYFHLAAGGVDPINSCRIVYQMSGWMIFAGTAIAEFVLIFRTWAVWGQNRNVAIGLIVFLFSLGIPSMYLTYIGESSVDFEPSPIPRTQRCFIARINDRTMLSDYLVILAVETLILILTLIKGVQHYRRRKSSLVTTLYEDGLLYYIYLTTTSIANVGVYGFPDQSRGASLILLQRVFHAMFTGRILLHLRLAAVRDRGEAARSSTPPVLSTLITLPPRGQLSTVILGVDTWCCTTETMRSDSDGSQLV